jgi:sulfur carrier protein ThiS
MARTISVEYINHDASGFADRVEVAAGTTISEFFKSKMSGREARSYVILVNRQNVRGDYVLADGDKVSVTPSAVKGACA